MHIHGHRIALWTGGLKVAAGFALALMLLLIVNFYAYRQLTVSRPDPVQGDEMLRILVVTDLCAIAFLSGLVLFLNRHLSVREASDRTAKQAREEQVERLRQRITELTGLNQTLQADIAERHRAESHLKQFQKMESLGKLVGGVSHEFNNYLTVILGFSEQLLMQTPPESAEHATVAEIFKAGERSAELTRALLGLVRTSDNGPRPIDVNRQVDAMQRILNVLVGKRVRVEMELQGDLPLVEAVPGQVEQVLLNLAANSRDAMPQGGRLAIETRAVDLMVPPGDMPPGHYVMLSVTDTGCGMDDETKQRMFEPFYTTKEKGTGLGLSTVQELVSGVGGAVVADSTVGQGTNFKVYWPALAAGAERETRAERDTLCHATRGERDTLRG
jgi:signal transduction histidine kinase